MGRGDGPVAVFGCGLIGASVAAGLTAAGREVWGADRRDLTPLVERGWIARQVPPDELTGAAVVLLALPPRGVTGALERFPFRPRQLVTDVAGIKVPVERAARRLPRGVSFVGGHPLAGGTGEGFEHAQADLFAGAAWVLSSSSPASGDPDVRERLERLVASLGAEPLWLEAERHDRLVALTSHLPQLLSTALAAELAQLDDPLVARLLGPGGRTFLRLAQSPYGLWREILAANAGPVTQALAAVTGRAAQPAEALEEDFRAARELMHRLRT